MCGGLIITVCRPGRPNIVWSCPMMIKQINKFVLTSRLGADEVLASVVDVDAHDPCIVPQWCIDVPRVMGPSYVDDRGLTP